MGKKFSSLLLLTAVIIIFTGCPQTPDGTDDTGDSSLTVSISGGGSSKYSHESISFSVSIEETEISPEYTWKVNGTETGTGASFNFDNRWEEGSYTVSVEAASEDGTKSGSAEVSVAVISAFLTSWKTDNTGTSADNQITLPLVANGSYSFTAYWGDGSSDTITAWDAAEVTHTYPSTGTYEVIIDGECTGWSFANTGDEEKLIEISNWGHLSFGDTSQQFHGCSNLTITAGDVPDLSTTSSLVRAFGSCSTLTDIPGINNWDTSNVEYLQYTFSYASKFNSDISLWNTSKVIIMEGMFSNAALFNQDISDWDTGNVESMFGMFWNASSFDQDLGEWDISSVTTMINMFTSSGLSTANYNALLSGWAALAQDTGVKPNVQFYADSIKYSPSAASARAVLTGAPNNWSITDGGQE